MTWLEPIEAEVRISGDLILIKAGGDDHAFIGAGFPAGADETVRWKLAGAIQKLASEPEVIKAEIRVNSEKVGVLLLDLGGDSYTLLESGDVCLVRLAGTVRDKTASFLDAEFGGTPGQVFAVDFGQATGFIPPMRYGTGFDQERRPTLLEKAEDAVGAAVKTVGLGLLGGFGAAVGWQTGSKLVDRFSGPQKRAQADPARSPQPIGESPAMASPEDPKPHDPANPVSGRAASRTEHFFGLMPGDPL